MREVNPSNPLTVIDRPRLPAIPSRLLSWVVFLNPAYRTLGLQLAVKIRGFLVVVKWKGVEG
jgi:hypothetical protein